MKSNYEKRFPSADIRKRKIDDAARIYKKRRLLKFDYCNKRSKIVLVTWKQFLFIYLFNNFAIITTINNKIIETTWQGHRNSYSPAARG